MKIKKYLIVALMIITAPCYATKSSDLLKYLKQPSIPKKVLELAKTGYQNYQQNPLKAKLNNAPWDQGHVIKNQNWIQEIFGKMEDGILQDFATIEGPKTWTLQHIDEAYDKLMTTQPINNQSSKIFILVKGVGVSGLQWTPLGQNAVVQLASQFNYLESPGTNKVPVSNYPSDLTQGPLGSIEAAAAALHRASAENAGKLPHALAQILPSNAPYYQNGYLSIANLSQSQAQELYEHIKKNISKLNILPQWVMNEASGTYQLQVLAAAPSFQGTLMPSSDSYQAKICELLIIKQYEALAKIAVMQSVLSNTHVPIHLTLVGQGAFNNPPSVMKEAFRKVAEITKNSPNVSVYVHVFNQHAQQKALQAMQSHSDLITVETMEKDQFKTAPVPAQAFEAEPCQEKNVIARRKVALAKRELLVERIKQDLNQFVSLAHLHNNGLKKTFAQIWTQNDEKTNRFFAYLLKNISTIFSQPKALICRYTTQNKNIITITNHSFVTHLLYHGQQFMNEPGIAGKRFRQIMPLLKKKY